MARLLSLSQVELSPDSCLAFLKFRGVPGVVTGRVSLTSCVRLPWVRQTDPPQVKTQTNPLQVKTQTDPPQVKTQTVTADKTSGFDPSNHGYGDIRAEIIGQYE